VLKQVLDEVTVWAESLELPIAGVSWDGAESPHAGFIYHTRLKNRRLDWHFHTEVNPTIPVLLTRIAREMLELQDERFLLNGLIHESRNPLSVLSAHLDLLPQVPGPAQTAHLVGIRRATDRVARRLEWASHRYRPSTRVRVSLAALWAGIVQDLEPEWRDRRIEWVFRGNDDEGWAITDPTGVEQILFNLAKNALEASPDHAVIRAECYQLGDDIVFRVFNSGQPLTDAQVNKLFRVQESSKGAGHGLGLALSQRLARSLGGCISYFADEDGVSFALFL
jgi:signal transduction histidine kinase